MARVTANIGVFDQPRVLAPRANTTLECHFFKFLQVKNHVSVAATVSTLGQFRITSSDATYSHPFWNSQTLTRSDFWGFQKQVWKISLGTASKRMPGRLLHKETRQPPITVNFLLRRWQTVEWRVGHAAKLGTGTASRTDPGSRLIQGRKRTGPWRRQGAQRSQLILPSSSSALRTAHFGELSGRAFGREQKKQAHPITTWTNPSTFLIPTSSSGSLGRSLPCSPYQGWDGSGGHRWERACKPWRHSACC